ncbi:MAG: TetR family transcriptional regulator [Marinosulfonomonas sp.]|nr:MAG: TetR family transcriptional regulator [Marinosulfonomonas sp.]
MFISGIAKAAGISRQAVYLHFAPRVELLGDTTKYVDKIKGLNQRLLAVTEAKYAIGMMNAYVDVWGNYLPEIHGLAGALLAVRETDGAAEAAWDECMSCHRDGCAGIVAALKSEEKLAAGWADSKATEMMWVLLSFQTWKQLTVECGWSTQQYIKWIKTVLAQTFVS